MFNNPTTSISATSGPNSDLGNGDSGGLLITNIAELTPLDEFGPGPQKGALRSLKSIRHAAIHVVDGRIRDFGPAERVAAGLPKGAVPRVLDAYGGTVVPGFVDCHTHLLYSGSRADEYPMRIAGAGYGEISSKGGGVARTIRESTEATSSDLKQALVARLAKALLNGTTT
ncbi:MAG: imidazolonepropionase, partial [Mesorhizobium sp.]